MYIKIKQILNYTFKKHNLNLKLYTKKNIPEPQTFSEMIDNKDLDEDRKKIYGTRT